MGAVGEVVAQASPQSSSLQALERKARTQEEIEALEGLAALALQIASQRKLDCLKVVGSTEFCDCLGNRLPVGVTGFAEYAAIVTRRATSEGKALLHKNGISDELIKNTVRVRDACVNEVFASR